MDQQHPRKVFEQAVALLKAGRRDEAETLCRNTLERDPGDINFVALLGSILADKGDLDEAETLLARAVKAAPGYAKAQEDLGTILLNRNRAEEAIPEPGQTLLEPPPGKADSASRCSAAVPGAWGKSERREVGRQEWVSSRIRVWEYFPTR